MRVIVRKLLEFDAFIHRSENEHLITVTGRSDGAAQVLRCDSRKQEPKGEYCFRCGERSNTDFFAVSSVSKMIYISSTCKVKVFVKFKE